MKWPISLSFYRIFICDTRKIDFVLCTDTRYYIKITIHLPLNLAKRASAARALRSRSTCFKSSSLRPRLAS